MKDTPCTCPISNADVKGYSYHIHTYVPFRTKEMIQADEPTFRFTKTVVGIPLQMQQKMEGQMDKATKLTSKTMRERTQNSAWKRARIVVMQTPDQP